MHHSCAPNFFAKMLKNFAKNRSKYLYMLGPNSKPELSLAYSVCYSLYAKSLMEEHNLTDEKDLQPYIEEVLKTQFQFPSENHDYMSLVQGGEQQYHLADGTFNQAMYSKRAACVQALCDQLKKREFETGRDDETLLHTLWANDGEIDSKNRNFKKTVLARAKKDIKKNKVEMTRELEAKGKLKRKHSDKELLASPTKLRFEKSIHEALHPISALPDESKSSDDYQDNVDNLIQSILTLDELAFLLLNCERHSFVTSVLLFDGAGIYAGATAIGECQGSQHRRRRNVVTLFRVCVKKEDVSLALQEHTFEDLFLKGKINENISKTLFEKSIDESQSEARREHRKRYEKLHKRKLPLKHKKVKGAYFENQRREIEITQPIFYAIKNVSLFLRQQYEESGQHRQLIFCERCLAHFWSKCEKYYKHISVCKGKGTAGLERLPSEMSNYDTHLYWHSPKTLEPVPLVLFADCESLLVSDFLFCRFL